MPDRHRAPAVGFGHENQARGSLVEGASMKIQPQASPLVGARPFLAALTTHPNDAPSPALHS
jgi:hypothetical protein